MFDIRFTLSFTRNRRGGRAISHNDIEIHAMYVQYVMEAYWSTKPTDWSQMISCDHNFSEIDESCCSSENKKMFHHVLHYNLQEVFRYEKCYFLLFTAVVS